MIEDFFQKCVISVLNSRRPGYGFVCDLVDTLLTINPHISGINNIAVIWEYEFIDGKKQEIDYFYPGKRLNLVGINKERVLDCVKPIVSGDADQDKYVDASFVWYSNFVIIPINRFLTDPDFLKVKGAILLLPNGIDVNLTRQQIDILHTIVNTKSPGVYDTTSVKSFLDVFMREDVLMKTIGTRLERTVNALSSLSGNDYKDHCGVRYATFWKLNMIEELAEGKFLKQYECCFDQEVAPEASHEEISNNDHHFINYVRTLKYIQQQEDEQRVMMYNYDDVVSSFADSDFLDKINMGKGRLTTILIPIIMEASVTSLDICCLYIKDIIYTPFVSKQLVTQLKGFIKKSLETVNQEVQSDMVNKLMTTYFTLKENISFYNSVAITMAQLTSMTDCLIYTCGAADELLFVKEEDVNNPQSYKTKLTMIGNRRCYVPFKYIGDKQFMRFLENFHLLDIGTGANAYLYRETDAGAIVKSALCILIQDNHKKENSGIIILINKTHTSTPSMARDYDVITMDSVIATYLSALYLHQFGLWNKAVSRKNYLLKKLRHEIPNCTRVIGEKMREIGKVNISKQLVIPSLPACMNTIELNRSRINMLASFFAAVDYDDCRFAEKAKKRDLIQILNENMPLFREQAESKGVDIIFNKYTDVCYLNISAFYPLAIVNVVNNAIRYCSRATNIVIDLYEDRLEVTDIGLPIKDHDIEMIFEDGFRSLEAKEKDSEGIGYGLHLSKRVLKAHNSSIIVYSDFLSDENYFLESGVAYYIKLLPQDQRLKFITRDSAPPERIQIDRLYERINKYDYSTDNNAAFYNRKEMIIRKWMAHEQEEGGASFVEMEENWFMDPVAKVVFTIQFGTKIRNI